MAKGFLAPYHSGNRTERPSGNTTRTFSFQETEQHLSDDCTTARDTFNAQHVTEWLATLPLAILSWSIVPSRP